MSEEGHPDEVLVPVPAAPAGPQTRQQQQKQSANKAAQQPTQRPQPPQTPNTQHQRNLAGNGAFAAPATGTARAGEPVAAFFSARAVATDTNQSATIPQNKQALFNPKAESPSIRKTPGIDHSSSKPLTRSGQHVPPPSQTGGSSAGTPSRPSAGGGPHGGALGTSAAAGTGGNVSKGHAVNPGLDQARRIGAPGGPASPLANRNSYKPPTMKRPLGQGEGNAPRVPLSEIPHNGPVVAGTAADGVDTKRQKMA